jgi:hypothetical protein
VVFANGHDVQADFFGMFGDGDEILDPFGLAGRLPGNGVPGDIADRENSDLHWRTFFRAIESFNQRPCESTYSSPLLFGDETWPRYGFYTGATKGY